MKIKNKKIFLTFALSSIMFFSCSKMNDMHQMYLDEGEIIYAAMLDSVASNPGYNRIEFEMYALSQRIAKVRIYWNNNNDSLDVNINNVTGIFDQIVSSLEEGEQIFKFVSIDMYNNKSLEYEHSTMVYGDDYNSRLINRHISSVTYDGNDIVIKWQSIAIADVASTILTYQNIDNEISEVSVLTSDFTTTLTDAKPGGEFSYKTLYLPTPNAIDIFSSITENGIFPKESE
jgi:hypothetical protein